MFGPRPISDSHDGMYQCSVMNVGNGPSFISETREGIKLTTRTVASAYTGTTSFAVHIRCVFIVDRFPPVSRPLG